MPKSKSSIVALKVTTPACFERCEECGPIRRRWCKEIECCGVVRIEEGELQNTTSSANWKIGNKSGFKFFQQRSEESIGVESGWRRRTGMNEETSTRGEGVFCGWNGGRGVVWAEGVFIFFQCRSDEAGKVESTLLWFF